MMTLIIIKVSDRSLCVFDLHPSTTVRFYINLKKYFMMYIFIQISLMKFIVFFNTI